MHDVDEYSLGLRFVMFEAVAQSNLASAASAISRARSDPFLSPHWIACPSSFFCHRSLRGWTQRELVALRGTGCTVFFGDVALYERGELRDDGLLGICGDQFLAGDGGLESRFALEQAVLCQKTVSGDEGDGAPRLFVKEAVCLAGGYFDNDGLVAK